MYVQKETADVYARTLRFYYATQVSFVARKLQNVRVTRVNMYVCESLMKVTKLLNVL